MAEILQLWLIIGERLPEFDWLEQDPSCRLLGGFPTAEAALEALMPRLSGQREHPVWAVLNLPSNQQSAAATTLLRAGLRVLAQLPLAAEYASSKQLLTLARQSPGQLVGYLPLRLTPEACALKARATPELLGRAFHAYTRWTSRDRIAALAPWRLASESAGGGTLVEQALHRIDLAWWLMGCPKPLRVSAVSYDYFIRQRLNAEAAQSPDVEDFSGGLIYLEGGASILFESSWASWQGIAENRATRVMGTRATLVHRNLNGQAGYHAILVTEATDGGLREERLPMLDTRGGSLLSCWTDLSCDEAYADHLTHLETLHGLLDALRRSAILRQEVPVVL